MLNQKVTMPMGDPTQGDLTANHKDLRHLEVNQGTIGHDRSMGLIAPHPICMSNSLLFCID